MHKTLNKNHQLGSLFPLNFVYNPLIRCSFSVLSNSLDEHFFFLTSLRKEIFRTIITTVPVIVYTWSGAHFLRYKILSTSIFIFIFVDFLKEFYSKENLWTIITTVPVIVYTWFGAHFLRCHILLMTIFFTSLRDFTERNFLDNHNYRTRHSIQLIGCSFSSLTYSLEAQFFFFLLFPQRVLLNEHFFENHNYRIGQNIHQRRKRAPDQAYTMVSTVVMKKIASLENFTRQKMRKWKKMSTGPSLYYEGYGSYGCPKNVVTINPLRKLKKLLRL